MNTKTAAAYLGKSERQLERMRHLPDGPPWKRVGARYDYYASQLDWWRRRGDAPLGRREAEERS